MKVVLFENSFGKTSSPFSLFVFVLLRSIIIDIVPPSFVNLTAFLSRFEITLYILILSAFMKIAFSSFGSKIIFTFLALLLVFSIG
jgi:hypothetical protein